MEHDFTIELTQQADYRFATRYDAPGMPLLVTDERPPLGADAGPNPSRLLATAVANCLLASLLFAMRKFGNEPGPLRALAAVHIARNEAKRMRVRRIAVDIHLGVAGSDIVRLERILGQFEEFCIVTQSVRAAIAVDVRVLDRAGVVLKGNAEEERPAVAVA